jgi:transcriptional regulator with XRE-family HTH domain
VATDPEDDLVYLRSVGLRVKLLRVARGMSQGELGAASGVSRVTVGSIERGDHPASVLAYRGLARAFGVSLAELLDERVPRAF